MAESRRKSPKAAPQEPAQNIPFDNPDPVAPDDHFEIEVDPETHVETSEQHGAQAGGEARPTASEGAPGAGLGTDLTAATDETPDENWSLEKLAWYAARAEERARRCSHGESVERYRLGKALHFARKKTRWGDWNAWLDKTFTFSRMTACRARQLYLRATEKYGERAEDACGNLSIDELYVLLGIKKKDDWLINEEDDDQAPAQAKGQGAQQPTATKSGTKKRNRAKGKGRDKSQPASRKPSTLRFPTPGDGEQPGEAGSGDDADEPASGDDADQSQDSFPSDPRSYAEELWEQEYAAHDLIRIAADSLQDALDRIASTMPEEEQTLRVTLTTLEQIKDHAERLTQLCEARREASR